MLNFWNNLLWDSKLFQTRLCKYYLFNNWTYRGIPYNLILTTKCNDSSILITIITWDYLNLSLANEYVGDVTVPTQVIKYNQCCSGQIRQSDDNIHIKLNDYLWVQNKMKTLSKLSTNTSMFICSNDNQYMWSSVDLDTWYRNCQYCKLSLKSN
jgi:hypothetical protein